MPNPAIAPVPSGHWTLRDEAAQGRCIQTLGPYMNTALLKRMRPRCWRTSAFLLIGPVSLARIVSHAARPLAALLAAGAMGHGVAADSVEFDRALLAGTWAESDSTAPACARNNLHYKLELSADGKTLVFKLDRKWKIASGAHVEQYSATVLDVAPQMLTIRYNADIGQLPPDYPAKWEMAFVGPGIYRWRATEWRSGEVNNIVGVRCEP